MNIKRQNKKQKFWAGLIGSVFLILSAFGVDVGDQTASAVINAVCSLLVVLGIVASPVADGGAQGGDSNDRTTCGLTLTDLTGDREIAPIIGDCAESDGDNECDGKSE